ncbi:MAG TPA: amino acid--[acyl-carrier-protein] ligase [Solirubrobacteraceae bacterium]|nr:amino acid--[acyl-carrier-protein] ligase [Solirubrobacteraceae bacterium]
MAEFRPGTAAETAFLADLVTHGLLIESGVPGVYGRGDRFELVRGAFDALITRAAAVDAPERMAFPPLLPRRQLEKIGYLKSFPHLAGAIFAFDGDEQQAAVQEERARRHQDWSEFQSMTDLVLTPAACYPVYPAVAARGPLQAGGITVDAGGSYVFRHEPSGDPARLQMFHQREIVRIGAPETVASWRDAWRDRSVRLLKSVGLDVSFDVASDPFFGRSGRLLARSQRAQELKFEVLAQIAGPEPTAVASFNYHQDYFSSTYGIAINNGGGPAHTACLGFGLERITLALFRAHGFDVDRWPATVREELGIG